MLLLQELRPGICNELYYDVDWIYELAGLFKDKYEEKRNMIEK